MITASITCLIILLFGFIILYVVKEIKKLDKFDGTKCKYCGNTKIILLTTDDKGRYIYRCPSCNKIMKSYNKYE